MTKRCSAAVLLAGVFGIPGFFGEARAAGKVTYEDHVLPVFRTHCGNCHNQDKAKGDLALLSYSAVMKGGSSGMVVEAGNADSSRLYKLMAHQDEPKMPPAGKVPDKDLSVVKEWIEGGLLEKSSSQAKASKKPRMDLALAPGAVGKPSGPAAMPTGDWLLDPVVRSPRAQMAYSMATSPWGPVIAVGSQFQVLLYNSDSLELVGVLPFPEGMPYVVKFSRNGSLLLAAGGVAGKTGKAVLFKVDTGERVIDVGDETDAVNAADVSADQSMIAIGCTNKLVKIFSTKDGQPLQTMKKHTDWVTNLEFSPDGVLLASGDRNGGLIVWESASGREFYTLAGHTAAISSVSWRGDSNVLASASEDTTIRLWEMVNGTQIKSWGGHGGGVLGMQMTHDGRIASCGRDNVAKLWKPDGGGLHTFEGFGDLAVRVTFNHDGSKVFCSDWAGNIRVWNAKDAKRVGEITPNPPTIDERIAALTKSTTDAKAALTAADAAAKAAESALATAKADVPMLQKLIASLIQEEKQNQAKATDLKIRVDRLKTEMKPLEGDLAGRKKLASDMGQNAMAVKEALAAAVASERALLAQDAALQAAQTSAQDLVNKTKAASARVAGDNAVKGALDRGAASLASITASREALKKTLGEAAQLVKELTEASARHNQTADRVGGELMALQRDLAERINAMNGMLNEMKSATELAPQLAAKKKAAEQKLAAVAPKLKPMEDAAKAAVAKRDQTAALVAKLTADEAKLSKAKVYAKLYRQKQELERLQQRAAKAKESAAATKLAIEKADLEIIEAPAKSAKLEALAKEKAAAHVKAVPAVAATAAELKAVQSNVDEWKSASAGVADLAGKLQKVAAKTPADKTSADAAAKAVALQKSLDAKIAELAPALQAKQAAAGKAAEAAGALQAAAAKAKADAANVVKRAESMKAQVAKLKARLPAETAELAAAEKALADARTGVDQLAGEYSKLAKGQGAPRMGN